MKHFIFELKPHHSYITSVFFAACSWCVCSVERSTGNLYEMRLNVWYISWFVLNVLHMQRNIFDTSIACQNELDRLLNAFTLYKNGVGNDANHGNMRRRMISVIIDQLNSFNSAVVVFSIPYLDQGFIQNSDQLFRGIADAICKSHVRNFSVTSHGRRPGQTRNEMGKYVYTWQYLHFDFKAFTRVGWRAGRHLSYYMQIVNREELQDSSGDSGADTDKEITDETWSDLPQPTYHGIVDQWGVHSLYHTPLQNLHDRINLLESTFKQRTTTAFRPRLE